MTERGQEGAFCSVAMFYFSSWCLFYNNSTSHTFMICVLFCIYVTV